jgi:hypothetical protein
MRAEAWLPFAVVTAWWLAMYPGLYGEDSLLNLGEALHGPVYVWFTAWWIYLVRVVTLGMRAIPLLTLGSVLLLAYATREWARAALPASPARAAAVVLICASPLVGAFGIQVRHDVAMTSGLLLCAAVLTGVVTRGGPLVLRDYAQLAAASLLVATRHNGVPTLVAAAAGALLFAPAPERIRWATVCVAVAGGAFLVTEAATIASGNARTVDPLQAIEWALGDISCALTRPGVQPTDDQWTVLSAVADRRDWPNARACEAMNPTLSAASFHRSAPAEHQAALMRVWLSLAWRYPRQMLAAHAERVRMYLPPLVTGRPSDDHLTFIHSTILPNEFGLTWAFPRVAGAARVVVRAGNAMRLVVAHVGLWFLMLMLLAWRGRRDHGVHLRAALVVGAALELGLLATAPISEGRYGLFILICGQTATLAALFNLWHTPQRSALAVA